MYLLQWRVVNQLSTLPAGASHHGIGPPVRSACSNPEKNRYRLRDCNRHATSRRLHRQLRLIMEIGASGMITITYNDLFGIGQRWNSKTFLANPAPENGLSHGNLYLRIQRSRLLPRKSNPWAARTEMQGLPAWHHGKTGCPPRRSNIAIMQ